MYRIFRVWKDVARRAKMEQRRIAEQQEAEMRQAYQLAIQFRCYQLVKKAYKAWRVAVRNSVKKRQYEEELRRRE